MNRILLSFLTISIHFIGYNQYCNSGGPSSGADSNIESLSLTGATGSISYTGCPAVIGIEEYLTETAFLDAGANYTVSIQFGTCGGNYAGAGEVWIDFNLDGVFDISESIGTWTGTPPSAMSNFNFTVPAGATTGQSRMRVVQGENLTNPINPCAAFTWGSMTDFSVYIQNGVDCSGFVGDDVTDPRLVNTFPFTENHDNSVCYSNQNPVYSSPDVYYLVIPQSSTAALNISLCGSSFDTFLSVLDTQGNILAINDDHIDCGIQSKLTVSTIGHDSVYVIVEGWGTEFGPYTISIGEETLGLSSLSNTNIAIYPNPAHNDFTVSNFSGTIAIIDATGNLVYNDTISKEEKIDISNLNKGLYFVKFYENNETITKKLIIQ